MTPLDARTLAGQLIDARQPAAAREIALSLVDANPNDVASLVALARAEIALGNHDAAITAARAAKTAAQTPTQNYLASLAMADVLAQSERFTRSQFWLRRAIQHAPNTQAEQVAVQAFRRVRRANPLAIELSFGLAPSDNVNSGNANQTINFAYLPGVLGEVEWLVPADERPLAGLELSLQTDLRYRIAQSETNRTSLEFGLFGRTYIMSSQARESAPDVTGESLSYYKVSTGILHEWRPQGPNNPYFARLNFTNAWSGGDPYQFEIDATLGTGFTLANEDRLSISGGVRHTSRHNSDSEILTYSLRGRWARTLGNRDVISLNAQRAHATSDTTDLAYHGTTIGVSYDFGDIIDGIDLETSYSEQFRVYETSAFDPAGREDRISSLRFDVGISRVDFFGFQPVVTVQGRRTDSSVPRFDTEGVQAGINFRSSF
ncbi:MULTISPECIES: surface lipoprotein assembly modifier [unclassified Octadecabacter]|uniref:surface lipoprotein assembly modifier n=1 Tax=unclassified Octadecabacter TaxID=196158 RepID=UPI001C0A40F1|nr:MULTISPECIES: surface lipoprotein assembly modifier [unclassified Octadecabacter]